MLLDPLVGFESRRCLLLSTHVHRHPSPFRSGKHSRVSPFSLRLARRLQRSRRNGCCHGNSRCKNSLGLSLGNPSWSCRAIGSSGGRRALGAAAGLGTEPGPVPGFKSPIWGRDAPRDAALCYPCTEHQPCPCPRGKTWQKAGGKHDCTHFTDCSSAGEGLRERRASSSACPVLPSLSFHPFTL